MDIRVMSRLLEQTHKGLKPVPILEGATCIGSVLDDPSILVFVNLQRETVVHVSVQTEDGSPLFYDYWKVLHQGRKAFVTHYQGNAGDPERDQLVDQRLT